MADLDTLVEQLWALGEEASACADLATRCADGAREAESAEEARGWAVAAGEHGARAQPLLVAGEGLLGGLSDAERASREVKGAARLLKAEVGRAEEAAGRAEEAARAAAGEARAAEEAAGRAAAEAETEARATWTAQVLQGGWAPEDVVHGHSGTVLQEQFLQVSQRVAVTAAEVEERLARYSRSKGKTSGAGTESTPLRRAGRSQQLREEAGGSHPSGTMSSGVKMLGVVTLLALEGNPLCELGLAIFGGDADAADGGGLIDVVCEWVTEMRRYFVGLERLIEGLQWNEVKMVQPVFDLLVDHVVCLVEEGLGVGGTAFVRNGQGVPLEWFGEGGDGAVSYTHLTLPTIYSV